MQIQLNAGAWRAHLRMRLAAERSTLLRALLGLDDETLTTAPIQNGYPASAMLATLAVLDDRQARRIESVLSSTASEDDGGMGEQDLQVMEHIGPQPSFDDVLDAAILARTHFLDALARASQEDIQQNLPHPWEGQSLQLWAECSFQRDASCAGAVWKWREREKISDGLGSAHLLLAALRASRKELLTVIALVPESERRSMQLTTTVSLGDSLRGLAEADEQLMRVLHNAGGSPNSARTATNSRPGWEESWRALHENRQTILRAVDVADDASLALPVSSATDTVYARVRARVDADAHTAHMLRAALGLCLPTRLLKTFELP